MGLSEIVSVPQKMFTKKHSLAVLFLVCTNVVLAQWEQKVKEDQWIINANGGYVQNGSDKLLALGIRFGGMTGNRLAGGALFAMEFTNYANESSSLVEFGPWVRYYIFTRGFGLFVGGSLSYGLYKSVDEYGAEDESLTGLIFGPDLGANIFLSDEVSLELLGHYNAFASEEFNLDNTNINLRVGITAFL